MNHQLFLTVNRCLFFFFLIFLNGCTETQRTSIAFGINTAPVTLDPRYATDAISYRITRLLYRSLVDFDEQFQAIPDIATWQRLAPDHYRFNLKQSGREFHNGTRLAAEDIKATYESVLNPNHSSPHRNSVAMIDYMQVVDDDTLDFYLSYADLLFPGRLVIGILPAELIASAHPFSTQPVGSGEMRLSSWKDESLLSLLRLSDDQVIEFRIVKDATVRALKLIRGEIDIIQGNLSPELVRWLEKQQGINIDKQKGNTFTYLGFNLEDSVMGNVIVRQAIAHAIDRETIIRYVFGKHAMLAGSLFSSEHWAGQVESVGISYSPEKSISLLKELGYDRDSPLSLVYKTSNNPFRLRLATVIQSQLKEVGIDVTIQSYDWGTFYADIKAGRFQMFGLSWVGLKMPDIFRYVFHSKSIPPAGANRGRLNDATVDRLIEEAEQQSELEQQAMYYQALQRRLLEVLPYVPLWYEDNVAAISQAVTDYTLSADGNFDALKIVSKTRVK